MVRSSSNRRRQRTTWSHLKQTEEDRTAAIKREPRSWLTIAVQSWPDRPTIRANSAPNQSHDTAKLEPLHRGINGTPCPTSSDGMDWGLTMIVAHDRGSIVARSPHDQGYPTAKSRPIHHGFEATTPLNGNHSHDASIPLPRPRQLPTIFAPNFPLKAMYYLLFFNF